VCLFLFFLITLITHRHHSFFVYILLFTFLLFHTAFYDAPDLLFFFSFFCLNSYIVVPRHLTATLTQLIPRRTILPANSTHTIPALLSLPSCYLLVHAHSTFTVIFVLPFFFFLATLNLTQALQLLLSACSASILFSILFILLFSLIPLTLTIPTFSVLLKLG